MNHNLKLNDLAATTVQRALHDIDAALAGLDHDDQRDEAPVMERIERIVPATLFNELCSYLGSIRDAAWRIDRIVFNTSQSDDEYGTELGKALLRHPSQPSTANIQRALSLVVAASGELTEAEAAEMLDSWPRGEYVVPTGLEALISDLDRGLLSVREFQSELDRQAISQSHPCSQDGCSHLSLYDDEPYCYTHSPDEGSSVSGYSWLRGNYTRVVPQS